MNLRCMIVFIFGNFYFIKFLKEDALLRRFVEYAGTTRENIKIDCCFSLFQMCLKIFFETLTIRESQLRFFNLISRVCVSELTLCIKYCISCNICNTSKISIIKRPNETWSNVASYIK
ncbi:hypothetical protein PUN28_011509 [Cardiocondyla obscurior]|uniref:Uncharacterized protein n=1 Tax=Cardiocondyla obscurior TaxID=286306 RepID=A0AAW2FJP9_9HYME